MKHILALLSWGQICILKDPGAFTFAKMEVGHPVLKMNPKFDKNFAISGALTAGKVRALTLISNTLKC